MHERDHNADNLISKSVLRCRPIVHLPQAFSSPGGQCACKCGLVQSERML